MTLSDFDVLGEEFSDEETEEIIEKGDPRRSLVRYRPDGSELFVSSRINLPPRPKRSLASGFDYLNRACSSLHRDRRPQPTRADTCTWRHQEPESGPCPHRKRPAARCGPHAPNQSPVEGSSRSHTGWGY